MTHAFLPPVAHPRATPTDRAPEATVTAQEMARLTGVGRERLRTWERRHGFPVPTQSAHGNRRYRATDVGRVIAVRQLARQGVPLVQAVDTVRTGALPEQPAVETLGPALDRADAPAVVFGGPLPLRVVWANQAARDAHPSLRVGAAITHDDPWPGRAAIPAIEALIASERDAAAVVEHGVQHGAPAQSLAWRASSLQEGQATVVVLQLPDGAAVATAPLQTMALHADVGRWVDGVARARSVLAAHPGLAGTQRSLRTLREALDAIDALLVFPDDAQLRTATSVRRIIAGRAVAAADCAAIADAPTDTVAWLSAVEGRALGLPPGMRGAVIPLAAGGSFVGAAVLVFAEAVAIDLLAAEVALAYGTVVATMIQRDRAAARARHARRATGGDHPHEAR